MFRALNERSSDEDDSDSQEEGVTKEALEEESFSLYNKALDLQRRHKYGEAEETYRLLLATSFVRQINMDEIDDTKGLQMPNAILKYNAHKNLATIAFQKDNYDLALENYLESVRLDSTDVLLWHKIGVTGMKCDNYPLARIAFQESLKINPHFWPSIDNLLTVLYALNDYANCLYYISKSLEQNPCYVKALVFREAIFEEHTGLQRDSESFFTKVDECAWRVQYDKEAAKKQYIEECLKIRERRRELARPKERPFVSFNKPFKSYTWKNLGECILALYDYVTESYPKFSLTCHVDTERYLDPKTLEEFQESRSNSQSTCGGDSSNIVTPVGGLLMTTTGATANDAPSLFSGVATVAAVMQQQQQQQQRSSATSTPCFSEMDVDESGDTQDSMAIRRGPKRKRLNLSEFADKRRSARVRNIITQSKKQDNVDYVELLQKYLPLSLVNDNSEEAIVPPLGPLVLNIDKNNDEIGPSLCGSDLQSCGLPPLTEREEDDVCQFLKSCKDNAGVVDLLYQYVVDLGKRHRQQWYPGIQELYIAVYDLVREHTSKPSLFLQEQSNEFVFDEGILTLVQCELKLDRWNQNRSALSPSAPRRTKSQFGKGFPGKFFEEDLEFVVWLSIRRDILGADWSDFCIRVMWARARFLLLQGQMDLAVASLDKIAAYLSENDFPEKLPIKVPNCKVDNTVSYNLCKKQLDVLTRLQSLEEVQRLFESEDYYQVVELLIPTFHQPSPSKKKVDASNNIPDRNTQLLLLQESLWNLANLAECMFWTEMAFNEAIQQYSSVDDKNLQEEWFSTLIQLLIGLEKCISKDVDVFKSLEKAHKIRLAQNLIRVIAIQNDIPDSMCRSVNVVQSWIVLYRLVDYEERKRGLRLPKHRPPVMDQDEPLDDGEFGPLVPASLMVLYHAHDFLSRRSWCCNSDGSLLLLYVDILIKELNRYGENQPHPCKTDLEINIEQCFYCLYGHPQKRTKTKHLVEHSSTQIPFTWERAYTIYNYFKPKPLPEFDSLKANTVSAELELLLKVIMSMVPQLLQPTSVDQIALYIEDATGNIQLSPGQPTDDPIVQDLYYLLADYYFKNKEFGKAIKFYIQDICINQNRFDSWTGLGMCYSGQLDKKLNSCELKNDGAIYKKSGQMVKCIQKALEINKKNATLCIEFGQMVYLLHSHASRLMKQQANLVVEEKAMLRKRREEYLEIAEKSFREANQIETDDGVEEQWVNHYMLGKVSEKQENKSIGVILEHYRLALMHLHEREAKYPKKIPYQNPPLLALEAVEAYYRTHAYTLKYLQKHESQPLDSEVTQKIYYYLKEAAASPFANFIEQENSRCTSLSSSDAEDQTPTPPLPPPQPTPGQKPQQDNAGNKLIMSDHDYFRRKRKDSSADESSEAEPRPANVSKRPRNSVDSSSESMDATAVKDILNSLVTVVIAKNRKEQDMVEGGTVVVLGDKKVPKSSERVKLSVAESDVSKENIVTTAGATDNQPTGTEKPSTEMTPDASRSAPVSRSDSVNEDSDAEGVPKTITIISSPGSLVSVSSAVAVPNLPADKNNGESEKQQQEVGKLKSQHLEQSEPKRQTDKQEQPQQQPHSSTPQQPQKEQKPLTIIDPGAMKWIKADENRSAAAAAKLKNAAAQGTHDAAHDTAYLINMCIAALKQCLQRFPQHYKSLYRLAHYFCYSKLRKNLQWSRDYLLGRNLPWNQMAHMPSQGLFSDRKNTNFFNGIWRIPSEDVDRPGNFASHMYRSIRLLAEVLKQLKDYGQLTTLITTLSRTPDPGKKYLRDVDRLHLAQYIQSKMFGQMNHDMKKLCSAKEPNPEKIFRYFQTVHRHWQTLAKSGLTMTDANRYFEEIFRKISCVHKVDTVRPIFDQIEDCIQQLTTGRNNPSSFQPAHQQVTIQQVAIQQPPLQVPQHQPPKVTTLTSRKVITPTSIPIIPELNMNRIRLINESSPVFTGCPPIDVIDKSPEIEIIAKPSTATVSAVPAVSVSTTPSMIIQRVPSQPKLSSQQPPKATTQLPKPSLQQPLPSSKSSSSHSVVTSSSTKTVVNIGSISIIPVGNDRGAATPPPSSPAQSVASSCAIIAVDEPEGLLGRLPSNPRPVPQQQQPRVQPKQQQQRVVPSSLPQASHLTAAVQSAMSALEPLEKVGVVDKMSEFQKEKMREIQNRVQAKLAARDSSELEVVVSTSSRDEITIVAQQPKKKRKTPKPLKTMDQTKSLEVMKPCDSAITSVTTSAAGLKTTSPPSSSSSSVEVRPCSVVIDQIPESLLPKNGGSATTLTSEMPPPSGRPLRLTPSRRSSSITSSDSDTESASSAATIPTNEFELVNLASSGESHDEETSEQ